MKNLKWMRLAPGMYEATGDDGTKFQAEKLARDEYAPSRGERVRWLLRVNGQVVDAGSTFAEIKGYCVSE